MNMILTVWMVSFLLVSFWSIYKMAQNTAKRNKELSKAFLDFYNSSREILKAIEEVDSFRDINDVVDKIIDFELQYKNSPIDKETILSYVTKFNEELDKKEGEFRIYYCEI